MSTHFLLIFFQNRKQSVNDFHQNDHNAKLLTKSGVKPLISIMGIKAAQHSPVHTASWRVKHTPSEDGALHGDKTA